MRQRVLLALMVLLAPASVRADPVRIVDTGPGPMGLPGSSLDSLQWIAFEFGVSEPVVITGVEGWMLVFAAGNPGVLNVSLYDDGGAIPGALLFRGTEFINSASGADWRGPSGLSWSISPGTYWIAFEPEGIIGAMPFPSERPLARGAINNRETDEGYVGGRAPWGVRISAETAAPVPEPASMLLLGAGLGGLAVRRRRRR